MDLEGFVLSTIPLAVATAHEAAGEAASVTDGRSFLLADGRGVRYAAIEPSDEDEFRVRSALAAKAAPQAVLSGEPVVKHELLARGRAPASRVAVAACRIYLRNAERDARNAGFGLWGTPDHVVKQASDWADVLAQQERFAQVCGEVSC
jgi:endonuclease YncB( thermonuclease family)